MSTENKLPALERMALAPYNPNAIAAQSELSPRQVGNRLVAGVVVGALSITAAGCGGDNDNMKATGTTPTADRIDVTVPVDPETGVVLVPGAYDCAIDIDDTANTKTLKDGRVFVLPKVLSGLKVDNTARTQKNRLAANNVANPLKYDDNAKAGLKEVQTSICEGPDMLFATGNGLASSTKKFNGKTLIEHNPWLKEFAGPAEKIDDKAKLLTPQPNDSADTTIRKAEKRARLASALNTLLGRMQPRLGTFHTNMNYRLAGRGLESPVGTDPNAEINIPEFERTTSSKEQYTGRFIALTVTEKGKIATCEDVIGLINRDDQRYAEPVCEIPEKGRTPARPVKPTGSTKKITTTGTPPPPRTVPPPPETTPPPNPTTPPRAKTPRRTDHQSVPGAPGSGGSPEQGGDPENDSNVDGYGPGDTKPVPEAPTAVPADNPPATSVPSPTYTTPVAPRAPEPGVTQTVTITPPAPAGGPAEPQD